MRELPAPVRLLLALGIGVFAFTGGALVEAVQEWRRTRGAADEPAEMEPEAA